MNEYLEEICDLLNRIEICDKMHNNFKYTQGIQRIVDIIRECKKNKKTLYICGNGGSAGIAQHMTADFIKNGGLRTYNMYGSSTITCISNDLSYEYVFSKQLELLANDGDVLIAISSSGESENIVRSINTIKLLNGKVITFTGFKENNRINKMGDYNVYVPVENYGMVESIHNLVLQQIVDIIVSTDGIAMNL